jgi:hypothetical protein
MEKNLDYLLTSDFNENLKPEQLIDLLVKFRYEYRSLVGKYRSLEHQIDKSTLEIENLKGLLFETDIKHLSKIALLEDEIHFLDNNLRKKLTLKERISGKIDRKPTTQNG